MLLTSLMPLIMKIHALQVQTIPALITFDALRGIEQPPEGSECWFVGERERWFVGERER